MIRIWQMSTTAADDLAACVSRKRGTQYVIVTVLFILLLFDFYHSLNVGGCYEVGFLLSVHYVSE